MNLYGFVNNNPNYWVDYLGLADCDCGKLFITRLPSKLRGLLASINDTSQSYNVAQELKSGGNVNNIVAAPRYSFKVTDSDCDILQIWISISAQPGDLEYFDQNPWASRPDTRHIYKHNADTISNNENVFTDGYYDPDMNIVNTSYYYDYTVTNQKALANGVYQIDQKQLYVNATVKGNNKGAKYGCGCSKTYWMKAQRKPGASGVDIGSIVYYYSGSVFNPPPLKPPTL